MKLPLNSQKRAGWKGLLLVLLLHLSFSGFTTAPALQPLSCIIENLQRTGPSQGNVSYSWNSVSGASGYKVYYVRLSDSYTSPVYTTGSTSMPFYGLASGTYRFFFAADCGETLEWISDEVIL